MHKFGILYLYETICIGGAFILKPPSPCWILADELLKKSLWRHLYRCQIREWVPTRHRCFFSSPVLCFCPAALQPLRPGGQEPFEMKEPKVFTKFYSSKHEIIFIHIKTKYSFLAQNMLHYFSTSDYSEK